MTNLNKGQDNASCGARTKGRRIIEGGEREREKGEGEERERQRERRKRKKYKAALRGTHEHIHTHTRIIDNVNLTYVYRGSSSAPKHDKCVSPGEGRGDCRTHPSIEHGSVDSGQVVSPTCNTFHELSRSRAESSISLKHEGNKEPWQATVRK